jgi:hypothetical protein
VFIDTGQGGIDHGADEDGSGPIKIIDDRHAVIQVPHRM